MNVWAMSAGGGIPKRANIRGVTNFQKNLLGESLRYHGWLALMWINDWGPPVASLAQSSLKLQSKFEDMRGTVRNNEYTGAAIYATCQDKKRTWPLLKLFHSCFKEYIQITSLTNADSYDITHRVLLLRHLRNIYTQAPS